MIMHQIELCRYKNKNKDIQLVALVAGRDTFGRHDFYTVKFNVNGRNKASYRGQRFLNDYSYDFIGFQNILRDHPLVLESWREFHFSKIDILACNYISPR